MGFRGGEVAPPFLRKVYVDGKKEQKTKDPVLFRKRTITSPIPPAKRNHDATDGVTLSPQHLTTRRLSQVPDGR